MRNFFLPATFVVLTSIAPMAFAAPATTTDGIVKSFNAKTMTLTLDNGVAYVFPAGFKDPGLKAGEMVSVVWDMQGVVHAASAVTIKKS